MDVQWASTWKEESVKTASVVRVSILNKGQIIDYSVDIQL